MFSPLHPLSVCLLLKRVDFRQKYRPPLTLCDLKGCAANYSHPHLKITFSVCVCAYLYTCHSLHMEVRGKPEKGDPLLPQWVLGIKLRPPRRPASTHPYPGNHLTGPTAAFEVAVSSLTPRTELLTLALAHQCFSSVRLTGCVAHGSQPSSPTSS